MTDVLFFDPIYQERVWGGRNLSYKLNRELPHGKRIGESWEISDRPEACSQIREGRWAGQTLREAIRADAAAIMGPNYAPERPFPILVKWLDCQERLSLQVHPPAAVADRLGGEAKTENWYIAEAEEGARLIVGLRRGVTKEEFSNALNENNLGKCIHSFPVVEGSSILVRSGQIHAIDGGNLILEIQQNSDTTYRVYDWGRVGLDEKPRQLHVEESLASIDFTDYEPMPLPPVQRDRTLADCGQFAIHQFWMPAGRELYYPAGEQPRLVHVVDGAIEIGDRRVERGGNFLILFTGNFHCRAVENAIVLVTENFV